MKKSKALVPDTPTDSATGSAPSPAAVKTTASAKSRSPARVRTPSNSATRAKSPAQLSVKTALKAAPKGAAASSAPSLTKTKSPTATPASPRKRLKKPAVSKKAAPQATPLLPQADGVPAVSGQAEHIEENAVEQAQVLAPQNLAPVMPPLIPDAELWDQGSTVKSRMAQLRTRNALLDEQLQRLRPPFQVRGKKK